MPAGPLPSNITHALGEVLETRRERQLLFIKVNVYAFPENGALADREVWFADDGLGTAYPAGTTVVLGYTAQARRERGDTVTEAFRIDGVNARLATAPQALAGALGDVDGWRQFLETTGTRAAALHREGEATATELEALQHAAGGRAAAGLAGALNQYSGSFPADLWLPLPVPLAAMSSSAELAQESNYLRLGYVVLDEECPAEAIHVRQVAASESIQTLRSASPIQKGNWHSLREVTLEITFNGLDAMNRKLLPLIRLLRKMPFLPVRNRKLNFQGITALSVLSFTTQTLPGFPHALQITLTAWPFVWEPLLPTVADAAGVDAQICWPLLKLWAEKPERGRNGSPVTTFQPFRFQWSGNFQLLPLSEDWLARALTYTQGVAAGTAGPDAENARLAAGLALQRAVQQDPVNEEETPGFEITEAAPVFVPGGIEARQQALAGPGLFQVRRMQAGDVGSFWLDRLGSRSIRGSVTLLRLRDPIAVDQLLDSPDLLQIVQTPVIQKIRDGWNFRELPGGAELTSPGEFKERFRRNLGEGLPKGEPGIREALRQGYYVFVVLTGSPVLQTAQAALRRNPVDINFDTAAPEFDWSGALNAPSLVVEQISASLAHVIAPLQVRGHEEPTHQYLGSSSVYWKVTGTLQNADDEVAVTEFFQRLNQRGRLYPGQAGGDPFGGSLQVQNELFQFVGTSQVLLQAWETETVPNFPDALKFTLTLVEFDPTARDRESFRDLMKGILQERFVAGTDLAVRRLTDTPAEEAIRYSHFNERLARIELYPDLRLPTLTELRRWVTDIQADKVWDWSQGKPFPAYAHLSPLQGGTGWEWSSSERPGTVGLGAFGKHPPPPDRPRYADPDFWCAPTGETGKTLVKLLVEQAQQQELELYDQYTEQKSAMMKPGQHLADIIPDSPIVQRAKKAAATKEVRAYGAAVATAPDTAGLNPQALLQGTGLTPLTGSAPPAVGSVSGADPRSATGATLRGGALTAARRARYGQLARQTATTLGVDPALLSAVVEAESNWNPRAQSSAGARGLGQLMSATAAELAQKNHLANPDLTDPATNLQLTALYLRQLLRQFGDITKAVAAYNAGPGAVSRFGGVPPYRETQNYVRKILGDGVAEGLYHRFARELGSTPDLTPAVPGTDLAEVNRLQRLFDQGYAFTTSQLSPWFQDGSSGPTNPFERLRNSLIISDRTILGTPVPKSDRRPDAFVLEAWLEHIGSANVHEHYFVLKPVQLLAFVQANRKAGKPLEPRAVRNTQPNPDPTNLNPLQPLTVPKTADDARQQGRYAPPRSAQDAFYDPVYGEDVFHDLRRTFQMGRLLQAFPTFYLALVDGGRAHRVWRLWDHVYGMMAVTQIAVHRTRQGPVETAVVGFSNLYSHLTSQVAEVYRSQSNDTRAPWSVGYADRLIQGFGRVDNETLARWAQDVRSLMLRPGVRLHLRLGFGADASELPVVFNGVLSSVGADEGVVEVVASSDGIELLNDLPPSDNVGTLPVTRLSSWLGAGFNPRELVMHFLDPQRDLGSDALSKIQSAIADGTHNDALYFSSLNRNRFGIEHFGKVFYQGYGRFDGELGVNVWDVSYGTPTLRTSEFDNFAGLINLGRWDNPNTKLLGIQMQNARPWDIFDTIRKTIPDYILYPVPVGLRTTLFMGKGWFPLHGEYRSSLKDPQSRVKQQDVYEHPEYFFQRKPFQQYHLLNSDWNLIGNQVRTDDEQVVTRVQAVGSYNGWLPGSGDMGIEASSVMMADDDIYDQHQKLKVVESGLYTTVAMKLLDRDARGTPGAQLFFSRAVLNNYAGAELLDHLKLMYQGPLVILGNPWLKPHDFLGIHDSLSRLNGLAEARSVTHLFSAETGFITQVVPDCLGTFADHLEGLDLYQWLGHTTSYAATAIGAMHLSGVLSRKISATALRSQANRFLAFLRAELKTPKAGKVLGIAAGEVQQALNQFETELRAAKGRPAALRGLLGRLTSGESTLRALFSKAPLDLQLSTRVARGLTDLEAEGRALGERGRAVLSNVAGRGAERLTASAAAARAELAAAQSRLAQLGGEERAAVVAQKLQRGAKLTSLTAGERAVHEAAEAVRGAAFKVKGWEKGAAAFTRFSSSAERGVLTGLSKKFLGGPAAFVASFVVGGSLAELVYRSLVARQATLLLPLRIGDREFSAGIEGHRGLVLGDVPSPTDQVLRDIAKWSHNNAWFGFIPFLGEAALAAGDVPSLQ